MRSRVLLATVATVGLLASGCGSAKTSEAQPGAGNASASTKTTEATKKMDMSSMDMGSAARPSAPAKMICSADIRDAVRRSFALSSMPAAKPSWSKSDRVYSCTYRLQGANLALSVQDSLDKAKGRTYFDALQQRVPGAKKIRGMGSFGFPSFETSSGNVVFLKDGKTLRVDASALPASALPSGFSRQEAAFSVASAVIACWSE